MWKVQTVNNRYTDISIYVHTWTFMYINGDYGKTNKYIINVFIQGK